jgi:hypothetical protein
MQNVATVRHLVHSTVGLLSHDRGVCKEDLSGSGAVRLHHLWSVRRHKMLPVGSCKACRAGLFPGLSVVAGPCGRKLRRVCRALSGGSSIESVRDSCGVMRKKKPALVARPGKNDAARKGCGAAMRALPLWSFPAPRASVLIVAERAHTRSNARRDCRRPRASREESPGLDRLRAMTNPQIPGFSRAGRTKNKRAGLRFGVDTVMVGALSSGVVA